MKKKIVSLLLTLAMLAGLMPTVALAEGDASASPAEIRPDYAWYEDSSATTFTIDSVEGLVGLSNIANGKDGQTKFNFAGKTVKLVDDLTFDTDEYWYYNLDGVTMVDYRIKDFAGTFDGQAGEPVEDGTVPTHTITGLKFYDDDYNKTTELGLFHTVTAKGSVKNLTLDTARVDFTNCTKHGNRNKFGAIAYMMNGKADNCHVNHVVVNVEAGTYTDDGKKYGYTSHTGSMFGVISGSDAVVTNSTAKDVSITVTGIDNGEYVGGFAGLVNGGASVSKCSIEDVYFKCSKKLKGFGGFVGYTVDATLNNCTATAIEFNIDDYYYRTGGFAGWVGSDSQFTDCKVTDFKMYDEVTSTVGGNVGGFVGDASGSNISFTRCIVSELDLDLEHASDDNFGVGGFAGHCNGATINGCSASGEIAATGTYSDIPVGGFIGESDGAVKATDCTTSVDVTAPDIAGGFVGACNSGAGEFTNCEATGSVTSTAGAVGGMIGYIKPAATPAFDNCTPASSITGMVASEVANAQNKIYESEDDGAITSTDAPAYLCYGRFGSYDFGFASIEAAMDAGVTTITLLDHGALDDEDYARTAMDRGVKFVLGEYTLTLPYKYTTVGSDNVTITTSAAAVDNRGYNTLREAIDAAGNGDTITLLKDLSEAGTEVESGSGESFVQILGKEITIDLGGFTFTGSLYLNSGAKLTIDNGSIKSLEGNKSSCIESVGGAIELGKDLSAHSNVRHTIRVKGGTAIIDGGEYKTTGNSTHHAVNISHGADVTINAGTFIGNKGHSVSGGNAVMIQDDASIVTISGGDFSNASGGEGVICAANGLTISGGTFDTWNYDAYLAEGHSVTKISDTKWVVRTQVAMPTADPTVFTYNSQPQTYTLAPNGAYTISGNVQTDAGTHTVTAALKEGYRWKDGSADPVTFDFVIGKGDAVIAMDTTPIVKTYGDNWELPNADSNFGIPVPSLTVAEMANAGTYTLTFTVAETDNYYGDTESVSVTVNKADPTVTAPAAKTLTHTGAAQELVTAGSVTGVDGTDLRMEYSLDQTAWSEEIPTGTNIGSYTVWYRGVGDENHNDVAAASVEVTINRRASNSSGSSRGDYAVSPEKSANGEITVSPSRADKGDTVTITVKPDKGYELDELTVTDKNGEELKLTETKDGKFTFTMPGSKVTIQASFTEIQEVVKSFSDVPVGHAFYDAVNFAAKEGIIEGYADSSFGVANPATVNAAVIVVARTMGQEFYGATAVADATAWASGTELTAGLDLTGFVSRETYIILLWRAAGMPMADQSVLGRFSDVAGMSDIGKLAMAWAVENGLINGYPNGTVGPNGQITRGAMAAIAMRYIQLG